MNLQLKPNAFWDVELYKLDDNLHADFIISRVFQFGLEEDLRQILKYYSKEKINFALTHSRGIDEKAISLAKVLGYL